MIDENESLLPFDVEIERLPRWIHALSAIVMIVGIGVALHLIPMVAFLPFLILSSIGRRFSSSAKRAEVSSTELHVDDRLKIAMKEIRDVWLDDEEPRVVVAYGEHADLLIMLFQNREQAERCAGAINKYATDRNAVRAVVGFRPRPIDALPSLRFLALAIAFYGTGAGWIAAAILALFLVNAFFVVSARQIVVLDDRRWRSRSLLGEKEFGAGEEIVISSLRDPLLQSPLWMTRNAKRVTDT